MRSQAFEKLLEKFEIAVDQGSPVETLRQLSAKSKILRSRTDASASVIREIMNGGPL